ncbi:MAG: hypothetical protein ACD_80C00101G0002 [uncultured bacterium (gcode 4)]|uniref:Uncharacterized protein n=1 Tax=uncultured bacterium (gcode 4) TaxID=1234023 RepID=K1XJ80_9BACT|nr:MAG: hypothetical protein ACD_80C00101G0002 [uncultured bacterium (gcode 4)]
MFLDKDTNPTNDIYYIGALILDVLGKEQSKMVDFFDIYQHLVKTQKVTVNLFIFALDWLFLIGLIKKGNKGYLEKCF